MARVRWNWWLNPAVTASSAGGGGERDRGVGCLQGATPGAAQKATPDGGTPHQRASLTRAAVRLGSMS